MSTLEYSKNFTFAQALWLTILSLLLISVCQRNDEANASGIWQRVEASNFYEATLDGDGKGLVPWQGGQFMTGDSRLWQRILIKNIPQEIEKTKEEKGRDDAFTKQLQQMKKSREASERKKVIPNSSTKMQPNLDKLLSRQVEKTKEGNKKDDLAPKLVQ